MRYIINDDDFEEWIKLLSNLNKDLKNETIDYILDQMENELKFNEYFILNKKQEQSNERR